MQLSVAEEEPEAEMRATSGHEEEADHVAAVDPSNADAEGDTGEF